MQRDGENGPGGAGRAGGSEDGAGGTGPREGRQHGAAAGPSGEPRWLSAGQLDSWRPFSAILMMLPAALDAQLQRDAGLNQFEYLVLAGLSEAPDRTMRMSTLAALANGSLSRLSHVVKRLEKRGYLRREPCAEDGRYTNAVLTPDGYDKLVDSAPGHVERVRELVVDVLDPAELRQLGALSERLLRALAPDAVCPGEPARGTPARGEPDPGRAAPGSGRDG